MNEARQRAMVHIDMDTFFCSVERLFDPELEGRPVIVGGQPNQRGVVAACSYEAREYGVHSAMPLAKAGKLCPHAVYLSGNFKAYVHYSGLVRDILDEYTPQIEHAGIDEAYLDLTGAVHTDGSAAAIGERLRAMVADEQQITCSVGIGPNKLIAKMASNAAKPDGLLEVPPVAVIGFLHPQPVEHLIGVGDSTAASLHRLGITTIAELAYLPRTTLQRAFGPHAGALLSELAWGRDSSRVVARPGERGVGCQETFARDTDDRATVHAELLRVSVKVASRMRAAGVLGRTVTLNLRFADFTTISRAVTLTSPTDITDEVYEAALAALARLGLQRARIRRVGVRVTGLVDRSTAYLQPTLDTPEHGWRDAEKAADKVIQRFGPKAVRRAVLTRKDRP